VNSARVTAETERTRLKAKLTAGQVALGVALTFPDAATAEYLAALGFDCIVVNAEHGPLVDRELQAIAMACDLTNCALMLRIDAEPALLERYVNLGVTGIQIPRVQSAQQVQSVVDAVKFPPRGRRGVGNSRANRYGLWKDGLRTEMDAANRRTLVMVQIEDRAGIAAMPKIAEIPEVDAVLIGEFDLSSDLGVPGELDHPSVLEALDEIFRLASKAGTPVGLGASTAAQAEQGIARGAAYLMTSVSAVLKAGTAELRSALP
jgi:4-hydroxy-2-oxoheptanedioate aldolase